MKKYLLGLGAMLVGAGLMFVFTHTEVSADYKMKKADCQLYQGQMGLYEYCKIEDLICVDNQDGGFSCFKKGGIFK